MEQYMLMNEVRKAHKSAICAQFPAHITEELKDTWLFFATSRRARYTVTVDDGDCEEV